MLNTSCIETPVFVELLAVTMSSCSASLVNKHLSLSPLSSVYMRRGDILMAKFRYKREVLVLSTADTAEEGIKVRVLSGNMRINISKPLAIEKYNKKQLKQ